MPTDRRHARRLGAPVGALDVYPRSDPRSSRAAHDPAGCSRPRGGAQVDAGLLVILRSMKPGSQGFVRGSVSSRRTCSRASVWNARRSDRRHRIDGDYRRSWISVQPVTELSVSCRLDRRELGSTIARDAFVDLPSRGTLTAFVRWGESPWPPATPEEGEALATALADLVDCRASRGIPRTHQRRLARSPTEVASSGRSHDRHRRLLERRRGRGVADAKPSRHRNRAQDGRRTAQRRGTHPSDRRRNRRRTAIKTPLFRPDELLVDGEPVFVAGDASDDPRREQTADNADVAEAADMRVRTADTLTLPSLIDWVCTSR